MLKYLHKILRPKNKKNILNDSSRTMFDTTIPSSSSTILSSPSTIKTKVDYGKILKLFSKSNTLSSSVISNITTINQSMKSFWFNEKYDTTLIQILEENPKSSLSSILLIFNQSFNTNITLLQLEKHIKYLKNKMQKRNFFDWTPYLNTIYNILELNTNLSLIQQKELFMNQFPHINRTIVEILTYISDLQKKT